MEKIVSKIHCKRFSKDFYIVYLIILEPDSTYKSKFKYKVKQDEGYRSQ